VNQSALDFQSILVSALLAQGNQQSYMTLAQRNHYIHLSTSINLYQPSCSYNTAGELAIADKQLDSEVGCVLQKSTRRAILVHFA